MRPDEGTLDELIEESQDLQADALHQVKSTIPELEDIGASRRGENVDLDEVRHYNLERRKVLRNGGYGLGALAARGLLGTAFGSAIMGVVARPAAAQGGSVDVQMLQTASSLEILAVATYGAALQLPFIANGNEVVKKFAETTRMQHDEHRQAFQAQTKALDGREQTQPNPKYAPVVEQMKPQLTSPGAVVTLAATLEEVATDTYLQDITMFSDKKSTEVMASVMGVESQHLATLRAVDALLKANQPDLIAIPLGNKVAQLPAAAGSVAFPQTFQEPDMASPPEEGAVK